MIILSGATHSQAMKKAQGICASIAATDYPIDDSNSESKLCCTVSVGGSVSHQDDTVEFVIKQADTAMYEAKHLGTKQVVGAEKYSGSFISKLWS